MDLLQLLNEAEDPEYGRRVALARREKVRHNKGECAEVAKYLVRGRMTARQNLVAIRNESANARGPSNCCARRVTSEPPWVDASIDP